MSNLLDVATDSSWLRYRFRTNVEANAAFGALQVQMRNAVGPWTLVADAHGNRFWVFDKQTKSLKPLNFAGDATPGLSIEGAMRMAWVIWLNNGIEPPDFILGQLFGVVELEALAYVLAHGLLPPVVSQAATAALSIAGVQSPSLVQSILDLVRAGVRLNMQKLDEAKVLHIAADIFTAAAKKADEAMSTVSDGGSNITQAEQVGIGAAALSAAIGDIFGASDQTKLVAEKVIDALSSVVPLFLPKTPAPTA